MKFFKTALASLLAMSTFAALPEAKAYDEDTHFYGTYAMARYAGIRHEVAVKIALSAQWMDESYISDPTSMIILPVTGVKKRRLLHFPSSRVVGAIDAVAQRKVVGFDDLGDFQKKLIDKVVEVTNYQGQLTGLNFMTETTEDHPFASELLMQGLKQGDLMMASASLHTLEDSFAHAGTPAEQGHASFWHWPDRPFASVDKYFRMVRATFSALVAIRSQLPPEALDCGLHLAALPSSVPNCQVDAETLSMNYSQTSAVRYAVSANTLKDPEYVATAVRDFMNRAVKANYAKLSDTQIDAIIKALHLDGTQDSYQAVETVIKSMVQRQISGKSQPLNVAFILSDMGRLKKDASNGEIMDYIDSYGLGVNALANADSEGIRNLVHAMAHELLKWQVPAPLTDSHRMEVEDDSSPIRAKEVEIRIANMRRLIRDLFNSDIELVGNNSKDQVGFAKEVFMDASVEPVLKKSMAYQATFNLREKNRWDHMIFRYLFPDLKDTDLDLLVTEGAKIYKLNEERKEYVAKRAEINKSDANWMSKKISLAKLDLQFAPVAGRLASTVESVIADIKPLVPTFLSDTVNTHITPSSDNYYYRNPRLFTQYRESGTIRPLLGASDAWTLEKLQAEAAAQTNLTGPK